MIIKVNRDGLRVIEYSRRENSTKTTILRKHKHNAKLRDSNNKNSYLSYRHKRNTITTITTTATMKIYFPDHMRDIISFFSAPNNGIIRKQRCNNPSCNQEGEWGTRCLKCKYSKCGRYSHIPPEKDLREVDRNDIYDYDSLTVFNMMKRFDMYRNLATGSAYGNCCNCARVGPIGNQCNKEECNTEKCVFRAYTADLLYHTDGRPAPAYCINPYFLAFLCVVDETSLRENLVNWDEYSTIRNPLLHRVCLNETTDLPKSFYNEYMNEERNNKRYKEETNIVECLANGERIMGRNAYMLKMIYALIADELHILE